MRTANLSGIAIVLGLLAMQPTWAQQPVVSGSAVPQLAVTGSAEVSIPANKASFSIGITTQSATAAGASSDNARLAQAVNAALRRAKIKPAEIVSTRFVVSPRWEYDQKTQRTRRTGFEATDTIQIETVQLAQLGTLIDAALGAGATNVSSVDFTADDAAVATARQQALSLAVAHARADAQTMAQAGDGALGQLLQLTSEQNSVRPGVLFERVAMAASPRDQAPATEVVPGQIKIAASVNARWVFVPTRP